MNAVKRCLTVLAVALVAGACGGDQTAEEAGTNLTIRATPSAVWMRNNTTAEVLLEAVDKLGGATAGSWQVTDTVGGIFTVAFDSNYQNSYAGPVGVKRRFVISATAEGDGSVTFKGTGDTITIPVRVAPDTGNFNIVISDSSPVLFQTLTVTAPAGIVFTSGTTVRMFRGPQARDTSNGGLSFPSVTAISADSTQVSLVMGPGAIGTMRFAGMGSRSTPGLTSTARVDFLMDSTPIVDTTVFVFTNLFRSNSTVQSGNFLDTLVVTAPANYRFLPGTSKVEFFRIVAPTTANPSGYTVSNGQSAPKIIGYSADSSQMRVLVAPKARGRLRISPLAFQTAPGRPGFPGINFTVRSVANDTINTTPTDTANMAVTFNKASPVAEGDTVTATAPAGMRFSATTVSIHATTAATLSGGDSARVTGYSADSSSVKFLLPPGASGKAHFIFARLGDPEITWNGRSAATISAAAAPAVVATVTPAAGNMNDTISIVLSAAGPYRFRPTSNAVAATLASPYNFVDVVDSLTLKVLPTPGTNAPVTLTNIRYAGLPSFLVQANTAGNVQVNAPTSLAPDDIPNSFLFNAPSVSGSNAAKGFWDGTTMTDADPSPVCDGGSAAQFYRFHVAVAGSYTVTVNWKVAAGGTDIDMGVMKLDGSYGSGTCSDYLSTSGLSSSKPEVNSGLALTVGDYVIAVIDYNGTTVPTDAISIRIVKN